MERLAYSRGLAGRLEQVRDLYLLEMGRDLAKLLARDGFPGFQVSTSGGELRLVDAAARRRVTVDVSPRDPGIFGLGLYQGRSTGGTTMVPDRGSPGATAAVMARRITDLLTDDVKLARFFRRGALERLTRAVRVASQGLAA